MDYVLAFVSICVGCIVALSVILAIMILTNGEVQSFSDLVGAVVRSMGGQ